MSPLYPESVRTMSLSEPVPSVQTRPIGYAPILKYYLERCQLISLIDRHVPCDPRRTVLTHGEACVALMPGIFHQVFQLYAVQKFATDTDILQVILPHIPADAYFDDRRGDTLDALYTAGLGDLELLLTRHMLEEFGISVASAHCDTTTASVYGAYAAQSSQAHGISLTFGFSKKHRGDLKQLIWSLSRQFRQRLSALPASLRWQYRRCGHLSRTVAAPHRPARASGLPLCGGLETPQQGEYGLPSGA